MIVLDASAVVEFGLWSARGKRVEQIMLSDPSMHAPELMVVEVSQVIRRLVAGGEITAQRGAIAVGVALDLDAVRYGHDALVMRVFELRHHLSAYDATYVALAEALGATLVTFDVRLAAAPGNNAAVVVP